MADAMWEAEVPACVLRHMVRSLEWSGVGGASCSNITLNGISEHRWSTTCADNRDDSDVVQGVHRRDGETADV